jgi:hypothetical protein
MGLDPKSNNLFLSPADEKDRSTLLSRRLEPLSVDTLKD